MHLLSAIMRAGSGSGVIEVTDSPSLTLGPCGESLASLRQSPFRKAHFSLGLPSLAVNPSPCLVSLDAPMYTTADIVTSSRGIGQLLCLRQAVGRDLPSRRHREESSIRSMSRPYCVMKMPSVGATRKICLGSEVRSRAEHELELKEKLTSKNSCRVDEMLEVPCRVDTSNFSPCFHALFYRRLGMWQTSGVIQPPDSIKIGAVHSLLGLIPSVSYLVPLFYWGRIGRRSGSPFSSARQEKGSDFSLIYAPFRDMGLLNYQTADPGRFQRRAGSIYIIRMALGMVRVSVLSKEGNCCEENVLFRREPFFDLTDPDVILRTDHPSLVSGTGRKSLASLRQSLPEGSLYLGLFSSSAAKAPVYLLLRIVDSLAGHDTLLCISSRRGGSSQQETLEESMTTFLRRRLGSEVA
ncbi:hypothetical protein Tco_0106027 [Tanacetum coccineum]